MLGVLGFGIDRTLDIQSAHALHMTEELFSWYLIDIDDRSRVDITEAPLVHFSAIHIHAFAKYLLLHMNHIDIMYPHDSSLHVYVWTHVDNLPEDDSMFHIDFPWICA